MRRPAVLASAALALACLGGAAIMDSTPRVVWNGTGSAPLGLWTAMPGAQAAVGDWVLVAPDPALAAWLSERDALPRGTLLIKRVAATAGQTVCRRGAIVSVAGRAVARAGGRDAQGRRLPTWSGCRRLGPDQVFLLNAHPDSLDGRYLGVTPTRQVVGRATLLWTP